jgi:hypothetical protein
VQHRRGQLLSVQTSSTAKELGTSKAPSDPPPCTLSTAAHATTKEALTPLQGPSQHHMQRQHTKPWVGCPSACRQPTSCYTCHQPACRKKGIVRQVHPEGHHHPLLQAVASPATPNLTFILPQQALRKPAADTASLTTSAKPSPTLPH